jgi:hypothetical protein
LIQKARKRETIKQTIKQSMIPGAFILKLKTPGWRLCVVKQVPEQSSSCWMLFGQTRKPNDNPTTGSGTGTTVQMEFQPHQEITLINHLTDLVEHDETELRLVLVGEPPAVSCFETMWSLQGQEMYRKQLRTASSLNSSLQQDLNMLRISPQQEQQQQQQPQGNRNQNQQHQQQHHQQQQQPQRQQQSKSRHPMQTRSKC